MRAKLVGMCRGDGCAFVKISISVADATLPIGLSVRTDSGTYVFGRLFALQEEPSSYVAMIALLSVRSQTLVLSQSDASGKVIGSCELRIGMNSLKWRSRANYRFRRGLAYHIRDIDRRFPESCVHMTLVRTVPSPQRVHVRIQLEAPASDDGDAWPGSYRVLDLQGHPTDWPVDLIGDQLIAASDDRPSSHRLLISIGMPIGAEGLCVFAEDTTNSQIDGMFTLTHGMLRASLRRYGQETLSAATDPGYPNWAKRRRALDGVPDEAPSTFERRISAAILLHGEGASLLADTLDSLSGQTTRCGRILLCHRPDDELAITEVEKAIARSADDEVSPISFLVTDDYLIRMAAACGGDYLALIEQGDILEPDAFASSMKLIDAADSPVDVIYCDEDRIDDRGRPSRPLFKPDWSPDLLRSFNYIGHPFMVRVGLLAQLGDTDLATSPAAAYDATLRLCERTSRIAHIPRVLYHAAARRETHSDTLADDMHEAGKRALIEHLARIGVDGDVSDGAGPGLYRIDYPLANHPKVSIIIPNKDHIATLDACLESILGKATYDNFEIVIVENNSTETATMDYYERMRQHDSRVKVITYEGSGSFNFSALVNFGAAHSDGTYLLLLNNDTVVISDDFIESMLGLFAYDNMGVVGAKLLYRDLTVQHAGVIIGALDSASHLFYGQSDEERGYMERAGCISNLSCVTGACQLIPHDVFDEVGGYDEDFAISYNDVDFCLKIRAAGKLVAYTPYARLFHHEYTSRGEVNTPDEKARSEFERALLRAHWPEYYPNGDPYYNPNLDVDSLFFGLDKGK